MKINLKILRFFLDMTNFDKNEIKNLQNLCKIKLTQEECENFLKDLKQIIDYIETLNEVDTKNVKSCSYILMDFQKNVFRKDEIKKSLDRENFLSNAPDQIASMIKVPEIFTKN